MSLNANKNLGQSFEKMKAMEAAEQRKQAVIQEFKNAFLRQGFSLFMASNLAAEKYKQIHKNDLSLNQ